MSENLENKIEENVENNIETNAVPIVVKEVTIEGDALGFESKKKDFKGKPFTRGRERRPRPAKEKPEFDSKTISVRRVTRVVSGGRRFSLAVAVAIGDKNGRVGFGTGKALDTKVAIDKATKSARKNMITLKLNKNKSISNDVEVKYKSAQIWITPNRDKGIIAGSSARFILALAGVNNVTAKFHSGTKNKINNARATMKALTLFSK